MRKVIISLFSIAMVLCIFICGIANLFDERNMSFNQEKVEFLLDGWVYKGEDGQEVAVTVPNKISIEKGKRLEIYRTFDEPISAGTVIGFRSPQQEIHVSLDGENLYSFQKPKAVPTFPDSPTSVWNIVALPEIQPGQVLNISSLSPYGYYQGFIKEIMLGTKNAVLFHIAVQYFPTFLASALVLLLAIGLLIYGGRLHKENGSTNFIYLGMVALLLGTWFFGESKYIQFFFGSVTLSYQMIFLSIALIPIPALLFFSNVLQPKQQYLFDLLSLGALFNFFAMVIAQTLGKVDFFEWLPLSHGVICLTMVLILYSVVEFHKNHTCKWAKFLIGGLSVFAFFGLLNIIFFYMVDRSDEIIFLQMGTFLSLLIIAKGEINKSLELIQIGFEASALKKAAYTDGLTQIGNRTAFDLLLDEMTQEEPGGNIDNAICIFDVDGLKVANDTYGHRMGDELICNMADSLKTVFQKNGKCFRIGGDEFAVLFRGDKREIQECLCELKDTIVLKNTNCKCHLSASWGIAFQTDTESNSMYEAFQIADALMYQNKEKKKKARNTSRYFRKKEPERFWNM